jgi:topoisomerase IV subunit B
VHILETPLFRVRNSKQAVYCCSEAERDASVKELRGPEVTRFKGLREISPGEFKRLIGPEMRLTPVRLANRHSVPAVLGFYMGRNTPERRQCIMNHLVVEAESTNPPPGLIALRLARNYRPDGNHSRNPSHKVNPGPAYRVLFLL